MQIEREPGEGCGTLLSWGKLKSTMNISEFAKLLNLSTGTVSRALNNRTEVSPKTRQRILAKAEELGYSRDSTARRLKTGKNRLIRLECLENSEVLSDFYLVELARAVEQALHDNGYDLLLRLSTQRSNKLDYQPVDGLIILYAPEMSERDYQILTNNGTTSVVVISEPDSQNVPDASYIHIDIMPGVQEALTHLATLGHRRIGYISSGAPGRSIREALPKLAGAAELDWQEIEVIDAGITAEDGCRAAMQLLEMPNRPTALFARTDVLAAGAIKGAYRLGLSVPNDVSVIGHDNIDACSLIYPSLTTVAIDFPQTGALATRTLLGMIDDNCEPSTVTLPTHLIVRESTGPCRNPPRR